MAKSFDHWSARADHHAVWEDVFGIVTGVALVTAAVSIYAHLGLVTGGIAGAALVVHYATGWEVGLVFFLLNAPFYALAVLRMGWGFTAKTVAAVALFSLLIRFQDAVLDFARLDPFVGAVFAALMLGIGLLAIFRHRASLGGVGILALYLQDRFGWRAGLTQLVVDLMILGSALFILPAAMVALSAASAVLMNLVLAVNHRGDRYIAR